MRTITDLEQIEALLRKYNWAIFNERTNWKEEQWDMTEIDIDDIVTDIEKHRTKHNAWKSLGFDFASLEPVVEQDGDKVVITYPKVCRLESRGLKGEDAND